MPWWIIYDFVSNLFSAEVGTAHQMRSDPRLFAVNFQSPFERIEPPVALRQIECTVVLCRSFCRLTACYHGALDPLVTLLL